MRCGHSLLLDVESACIEANRVVNSVFLSLKEHAHIMLVTSVGIEFVLAFSTCCQHN